MRLDYFLLAPLAVLAAVISRAAPPQAEIARTVPANVKRYDDRPNYILNDDPERIRPFDNEWNIGIIAEWIADPASRQEASVVRWMWFAPFDPLLGIGCSQDAFTVRQDIVDMRSPGNYFPKGTQMFHLEWITGTCYYKNDGQSPGWMECPAAGFNQTFCKDDPHDSDPGNIYGEKGGYICGDKYREQVFLCKYPHVDDPREEPLIMPDRWDPEYTPNVMTGPVYTDHYNKTPHQWINPCPILGPTVDDAFKIGDPGLCPTDVLNQLGVPIPTATHHPTVEEINIWLNEQEE